MMTFALRHRAAPTRPALVLSGLALVAGCALLAGFAPVRFSIVTVFLFAGPHNWLEMRYFLARLPARWGKLRGYFALAFLGIFGLSAAYIALIVSAEWRWIDEDASTLAYALVQTALVFWVALLAHLRSRTNPRRDWGWVWSAALLAVALAWYQPQFWSVALVYLHPLLALWMLDLELKRSRPAWRPAFHLLLASLPVFLGLLWLRLSGRPDLPGGGELSSRITHHAGADALPELSAAFLVAAHTFLEMLHYLVWIVAMPLIGLKTAAWRLDGVPLTWRGVPWRRGLACLLLGGAFLVTALWAAFLIDYPTTRTVYFAVATLHVMAEFPFLLRSL